MFETGLSPVRHDQGRKFLQAEFQARLLQVLPRPGDIHSVFRGRILFAELAVHPVQEHRKQRLSGQVAGNLDDLVDQFVWVLGQQHGLAQVAVAGEPLGPVIELDEENRTVHEAVDVPALLHRLRQVFRRERGEGNLAVLEEIQHRIGIGDDVGHVDAVEANAVLVPVARILAQVQRLAVHPAIHDERAVVQQLIGIGAVAPARRLVEVLPHGVVGGERRQLVEERDRPFEIHHQCPVALGAGAERIERQLVAVYGFGVLDRVKDKGVFRGVRRIERGAPGEHEVVGRDRLAVAPEGIAQVEDGLFGGDFPALGHSRRQPLVLVVAQEPFHDVSDDDAAHGIGQQGGVQLRRLLGQPDGDGVVGGIDRRAAARDGCGEAGQQVEQPHQRRKAGDGNERK